MQLTYLLTILAESDLACNMLQAFLVFHRSWSDFLKSRLLVTVSAKVAALEEDLDKLEDEQIAWDDERERLLIREKHLKQQHDDCRIQLKAADAATTEGSNLKALCCTNQNCNITRLVLLQF